MKNRFVVTQNSENNCFVSDIRTRKVVYLGEKDECLKEAKRLEQIHKDVRDLLTYEKNKIDLGKKDCLVDKPNHYIGELGLEVELVLRNFLPRYKDAYVAHRIASAIEYLLRSPLKNGVQDIEKAKYNLQQALDHLEDKE